MEEPIASSGTTTVTSGRPRLPCPTIVLGTIRVLGGTAMLIGGAVSYPTQRFNDPVRSVPEALVVTGAATIVMVLLEIVHAAASKSGAKLGYQDKPPMEAYRTILVALAGGFATVLGLVAAFIDEPSDAIRLGALALVIAIFLTFVTMLFAVFEPQTVNALAVFAFLTSVAFIVGGFGLACVGLSVFNR